MKVTITSLRQDLFKLADKALDGEPLAFVYKGVVFQVTPETKSSKLSKLTGEPVVQAQTNLEHTSRELMQEMESEWEKDWAEL
jgi:hypothetical protein